MYLSVNHLKFDQNNIIISEKTKNNVMLGSDFHRLIFSDEVCSTNGIYINFTLKNITIEKYFNKIKCIFEKSQENNNVISNVINIENKILTKFKRKDEHIFSHRIQEQLYNGFIKMYGDNNIKYGTHKYINFLLKISGIWVTNQTNEFGLTFRFFIFNNQF